MKEAEKCLIENAQHDCQFREILDRVGDKWTLMVIGTLERAPSGRSRFSELKRNVPGISQRMLTSTLRNLERDGLAERFVFPEIPPRVEYELTPLGQSLMVPVGNLMCWMAKNMQAIKQTRESFDKKKVTKR